MKIPYLCALFAMAFGLPVAAAKPTALVIIHPNQPIAHVNPLQLGSNAPAWLGKEFSTPVFSARTRYSGIGGIRIPGGSWSDQYGWLSCENRVFQQDTAYPCGEDDTDRSQWIARPTDFINFLRATEKLATYVVNINATAKEAAAAVAFFNARPGDKTPIGVDRNGFDWKTAGYWAELRASKGNPEPFRIHLWEVGNEVYGAKVATAGNECANWGWENAWTCDGAEYVNGNAKHDGYKQFREAMRAVDPSIMVGAVGNENLLAYNEWGKKVIREAGKYMDFYVVHPYAFRPPPPNSKTGWATILAQPHRNWTAIRSELKSAFDQYAGGRDIPIAATEYNLVFGQEKDTEHMLTRAGNLLFIADSIGQAIQNGFLSANQWALANGCSNESQTCYDLLKVDLKFQRSPQYFAFPLWAAFGSVMLKIDVNMNVADTLSVYAGKLNDTTYSVLAINKTESWIPAMIGFEGGAHVTGGTVNVARATSLQDRSVKFNGRKVLADDLSNARPKPLGQTGSVVKVTLSPYSVSLVKMLTK